MRLDVRQALLDASRAELEHNGNHVVLVASEVADRLRVWSDPIQIMAEPGPAGVLELVIRQVDVEAVT